MEETNRRMLDADGFDAWSDSYDRDVRQSDREQRYPFAGYARIQDALVEAALEQPGRRVLDIGIGTGTLSARLAGLGFDITGVDFSEEMLEKSRQALPHARLIRWDFAHGLPPDIAGDAFDLILCNYAIHHLMPAQQQSLIPACMARLAPGGQMLIADVATETDEQMALARARDEDLWDEDECYPVTQQFRMRFPQYNIGFAPFTYCSGILSIKPR